MVYSLMSLWQHDISGTITSTALTWGSVVPASHASCLSLEHGPLSSLSAIPEGQLLLG